MISQDIKKRDDTVQIMGVGVVSTSTSSVLEKIDEFIDPRHDSSGDTPKLLVSANPEIIMLAQQDAEYKRILNAADLVFADGAGLRLVDKSLQITPGRKLVESVAKSGNYRIFYLGGRDGVAKKMAQKYGGKFHSGHGDIRSQIDDKKINEELIKCINDYQPDILFVAYGAPWQEKWIWQNRKKINAKVAMGVGGSFDYLVGKSALPPQWMERYGLEWLWRLAKEPRRWRRQLTLVRFVWVALTNF
jgi:N-acetylglucosaminyldiphosphoundecaprenol N-acetyl-beta-D-mannosaminyltransferase